MHALDRKSTRLNSSHLVISYAVFCLKKKNIFLDEFAAKTGRMRLVVRGRQELLAASARLVRALRDPYSIGFVPRGDWPFFFFYRNGDHRDFPFFPTRRPSD